MFSHKTDHWSTPVAFYAGLNTEFAFTFDPCPLRAENDGLADTWTGRVFCNPPYSNIKAFIRKGLQSLAEGTAELVVYLVPARTDTAWFHDYVYGKAEIRFIRGRLKFGNATANAPFPSMLAIFKRHSPQNGGGK